MPCATRRALSRCAITPPPPPPRAPTTNPHHNLIPPSPAFSLPLQAKERISAFLGAAREEFKIGDTDLFTVSDLHDGTGPGQVLSCLSLMSKLNERNRLSSVEQPNDGEDVFTEEMLGSMAEEVLGDAMMEQITVDSGAGGGRERAPSEKRRSSEGRGSAGGGTRSERAGSTGMRSSLGRTPSRFMSPRKDFAATTSSLARTESKFLVGSTAQATPSVFAAPVTYKGLSRMDSKFMRSSFEAAPAPSMTLKEAQVGGGLGTCIRRCRAVRRSTPCRRSTPSPHQVHTKPTPSPHRARTRTTPHHQAKVKKGEGAGGGASAGSGAGASARAGAGAGGGGNGVKSSVRKMSALFENKSKDSAPPTMFGNRGGGGGGGGARGGGREWPSGKDALPGRGGGGAAGTVRPV